MATGWTLVQGPRFNEVDPAIATSRAAEAIGLLAFDEIPEQSRSVRNLRRNCLGVIEAYMGYLCCSDKAVNYLYNRMQEKLILLLRYLI